MTSSAAGAACCCCFLLLLAIAVAPLAVTAAVSAPGPCTMPTILVSARTAADILTQRLQYPPTQAVRVDLLNDIKLTDDSLVLNETFACTILTTRSGAKRKIWTDSDAFPAVQIRDTNNVLVQNVGFELGTDDSSGECPIALPEETGQPCPAVYIHNSWAVQVTQSTIRGRIDVCRSPQTTLDTLNISSGVWGEKGLVQIHLVGNGPDLVKSDVIISNCALTGSQIGVVIARAGVGVTVRNNAFRNHYFSGVQCGWGVRNVGDCMLTSFVNNYFQTDPEFLLSTHSDSSAMYFGTHWVNPGNYLSCNYAKGGRQCLYFDYASSGLTVDGMVCIGMASGLKLNAGHSNDVRSFVSVGARLAGWISCQNYYINNCNQPSGRFWDDTRQAAFNSARYQSLYPYLNNFCDLDNFKGVDCNPPGSEPDVITGKCSGIPTGNKAKIVIVDSVTKNTPTYLSCTNKTSGASVTSVSNLNSLTWVSTPKGLSAAYFNDVLNDDYGVPDLLGALAPLRLLYGSGFKSCPKKANGPQPVLASSYLNKWNVPPNAAVAYM